MKPSIDDRRTVSVRVSPTAFFDIAVAAIEAAMVAPEFNDESFKILRSWDSDRKNRSLRTGPLPGCLVFSDTGLEFAGCLMGKREEQGASTLYLVERAFPVTALRGDDWVAQSELSSLLLDDLASAAKIGLRVIGDVHSHPFIDAHPDEVQERKFFTPSATDKSHPPFIAFEFSLIATVSMGGRRKKGGHVNEPGPLHRSRIGSFEIWLYAYQKSNRSTKRQITLEIA